MGGVVVNLILTPSMIELLTRSAIWAALEDQRAYNKAYSEILETLGMGRKIGDTITVRRPVRWCEDDQRSAIEVTPAEAGMIALLLESRAELVTRREVLQWH